MENKSPNKKRLKKDSNFDTNYIKISERRKKNRQNQRLLTEYYSEGTSYGLPICKHLYELAQAFSREDLDMLWFFHINFIKVRNY